MYQIVQANFGVPLAIGSLSITVMDETNSVRHTQTYTKDGHLPASENRSYRFTHKQTTKDLPISRTRGRKVFVKQLNLAEYGLTSSLTSHSPPPVLRGISTFRLLSTQTLLCGSVR